MLTIGEAFDKAAKKYCHEDGCYVGTCPVNCLATLIIEHGKEKNYWMIFGDYMLVRRLGK